MRPTFASLQKFNIIFFGSDQFSRICLNALLREKEIVRNIEIVVPSTGSLVMETIAKDNHIKLHYAPPKSLVGWPVMDPFKI
jgi:hypothetical protein